MNKSEPEFIPRSVAGDGRLAHVRILAHLLDRAFRVPGTQWRFGLDAIIGLVPGLGDMVGSLIGGYSIWIARELGAPASIQLRMLMNLTIDAVLGIVPFAGDLFDFAFKAHSRNQALLEQWLSTPHRAQRSSVLVLIGAFIVLLAIFGAAGWLLVRVISWVGAQF
jgi:uncharacterized protein DUF4112